MPDDNSDTRQSSHDFVLSYHRVRRALGILGVLLPLMLIIGGLLSNSKLEPSISDYYHTTLRDIFVGCLFAIGIFLVSYKGYKRGEGEWISDDWVATLAGICAFGMALFPNESQIIVTVSQEAVGLNISPLFHYTSALTFFTCLAVFCYVKFPKTAKPYRRQIYIWCGHIIVASTLLIAITSYFKINGSPEIKALVVDWKIVFWVEAIGIWAFAFSWLTKGKADLVFVRNSNKLRARHPDAKPSLH
ncbi:MAG: hypothetical protein KAT26_05155 [Marinosulfonomonas sp.]|nr:hypothetical protein [Marinosulfonomonas sp.]